MVHYSVEQKSEADLATAYPHDPESLVLSMADYLEDKFSGGWDFIGAMSTGSSWIFTFRPNAVSS